MSKQKYTVEEASSNNSEKNLLVYREEPVDGGETSSPMQTSHDADLLAAEHILKRQKTSRELFGSRSNQEFQTVGTYVREVKISEIGFTHERFAVEGKVLNIYGTYDSSKDYAKYLKADLTYAEGFNTVTLVFGQNHYQSFLDKYAVNSCLRIEGANVCARNPNDGGSIDFSLRVDVTTSITEIPFFESELFFVPELSIRSFLAKASVNPGLKSTIAFVIVQADNIQKSEGGLYEQLTIADGPSPLDRATLTFVNKRKPLYHWMVDDFKRGNIVPILARNIGVWKDRSNTLSILDMTLIAPVHSEKTKVALEIAFNTQIKTLGYGKEVVGTLRIVNFNGTLIIKKCSLCKSQNVNHLLEGAFCLACNNKVALEEVVRLQGVVEDSTTTVDVSFSGETVDKILQFEKPVLTLCKSEQRLVRVLLSEVNIAGAFTIDSHGQVIAYHA